MSCCVVSYGSSRNRFVMPTKGKPQKFTETIKSDKLRISTSHRILHWRVIIFNLALFRLPVLLLKLNWISFDCRIGETRTHDPYIPNVVFYQLNYYSIIQLKYYLPGLLVSAYRAYPGTTAYAIISCLYRRWDLNPHEHHCPKDFRTTLYYYNQTKAEGFNLYCSTSF